MHNVCVFEMTKWPSDRQAWSTAALVSQRSVDIWQLVYYGIWHSRNEDVGIQYVGWYSWTTCECLCDSTQSRKIVGNSHTPETAKSIIFSVMLKTE